MDQRCQDDTARRPRDVPVRLLAHTVPVGESITDGRSPSAGPLPVPLRMGSGAGPFVERGPPRFTADCDPAGSWLHVGIVALPWHVDSIDGRLFEHGSKVNRRIQPKTRSAADWLCGAEKEGPWRAPAEARDKRSEILRVLSDPEQRHGETPRLQRYSHGGGTAARGDRGGGVAGGGAGRVESDPRGAAEFVAGPNGAEEGGFAG